MRLFLLILVIGFLLQLIAPWWIIGPVCFGLAFWRADRAGQAFLAGFLGIGLGWLLYSAVLNIRNEGLLAQKLSALFHLPWSGLLLLVTLLIGGLAGGFSALAGYFCRKLL